MTIEVNKNYVNFNSNTKVNKKEFKATPLYFIFSEEYKGLTCKCVFSKIPSSKDEEITYYQEPIINNMCYIPYEVMSNDGIMIGVYGYQLDGNELVVRYSPEPKNLWFLEGSYYDGASTPEEISPSQFEQYTAYLNREVERLNKIKIETKTITNGVKIEVTNSDGITTETNIYNGETGPQGPQGETVQYTAGDNITISNNVISATDTTYTAGDNITIEDGVISATGGGGGTVPVYFWDGTAVSSGDSRLTMFQDILDRYRTGEPYVLQTYTNFISGNYVLEDNVCNIYLQFTTSSRSKVSSYMQMVGFIVNSSTSYSNGIRIFKVSCDVNVATSTNTVTSVSSINKETMMGTVPYQWQNFTNGGRYVLTTTNTASYTPTQNYHPSTKLYTDKTHYENMSGYDATKTQVLKNINGTLTWVNEV